MCNGDGSMTTNPSATAKQRAREIAQRILDYLSVVPDVAIADCCHDHAVDQILEVLIPELDARDREIERLKDFNVQVVAGIKDAKIFHEQELTTARGAAVRECVEEVKDRLSVLEAQTASLVDPLAKAGCYGRDSAIREIVAALESLLTQETQPAHDMD
jgi:hypothetical protein